MTQEQQAAIERLAGEIHALRMEVHKHTVEHVAEVRSLRRAMRSVMREQREQREILHGHGDSPGLRTSVIQLQTDVEDLCDKSSDAEKSFASNLRALWAAVLGVGGSLFVWWATRNSQGPPAAP